MKFLVDECTGPAVARSLREQGYDVYSVFDSARGMSDADILHKAVEEVRILITNDKDFGESVFRDHRAHCGLILLRLDDETSTIKIAVINRLLETYGPQIQGRFVVVTEERVRFAPAD